jgi:hypothetical protein
LFQLVAGTHQIPKSLSDSSTVTQLLTVACQRRWCGQPAVQEAAMYRRILLLAVMLFSLGGCVPYSYGDSYYRSEVYTSPAPAYYSGGGSYYRSGGTYYTQPRYYQPAPRYYQQPRYYQAPRHYQPAPRYYESRRWHGNDRGRWDGHRRGGWDNDHRGRGNYDRHSGRRDYNGRGNRW